MLIWFQRLDWKTFYLSIFQKTFFLQGFTVPLKQALIKNSKILWNFQRKGKVHQPEATKTPEHTFWNKRNIFDPGIQKPIWLYRWQQIQRQQMCERSDNFCHHIRQSVWENQYMLRGYYLQLATTIEMFWKISNSQHRSTDKITFLSPRDLCRKIYVITK